MKVSSGAGAGGASGQLPPAERFWHRAAGGARRPQGLGPGKGALGKEQAKMSDWSLVQGLAGRVLAPVVLVASLSACIAEDRINPGMARMSPVTELGQAGYDAQLVGTAYRLRPADKLSVMVFREAELSVPEVTISTEGRISVPLIGHVEVAGMTTEELELLLEERYDERFLRGPDVAVNVVEYASHLVTVEGAVTRPGLYPFTPGTRLTGGISLAAGPERVAGVRNVAVFRQTGEGIAIAKFDYAMVRAGTMLDPVLHPGDRIIVGTDNLSQFWQDLLRALPAFGMFAPVARAF